jgi:hypothetical protein
MHQTKKLTVALCASASFYEQMSTVQEQLEALGFIAIVPTAATRMKANNDFDVTHYKTWFADPGDYDKKGELMRDHFNKVAASDAILVLNYEKHGVTNYIGPNVLTEMALMFYLQRPIFVLNELPDPTPFEEELKGMRPVILQGHVADIAKHL